MRTRGRVVLMSFLRSERLADDSHLVPGDLALANRQLDPAIARVGEVATAFHPTGLVDVRADSAVAEIGDLLLFKLDLELLFRCEPRQLVANLVEAAELALRRQPGDVTGEKWIQGVSL